MKLLSYQLNNMGDKIQVLVKFRPFLYILLNFLPKDTNKQRFGVIHVFGFLVVLFFVIVFFISDIWYCIDEQFNLELIAQPISILLGGLSMVLIYISFTVNSERVKAIVDFIQRIVEKSKTFLFSLLEDICLRITGYYCLS